MSIPLPRPLSRRQGLALFLVVLAAFMVLAIRVEINSNRISDAALQSCQNGRKILEGFNQQQDALANVERELLQNQAASPAGRQAAAGRIKAYEAGKIEPLPVCSDRKGGNNR